MEERRPGHAISGALMDACSAVVLTFRRYRVYPSARRIILGDREIEVGGRAFDLLVALLRARGEVVSQFEIVRQVWPSTTVDSCNLRFQMGALRKALGPDRDVIKTIRGRGYLIVDDCDTDPVWSIDEPQRSDACAPGAQAGSVDSQPDWLSRFAPAAASVTGMALSLVDPCGHADPVGPDLLKPSGTCRSVAIGEIDPANVSQRLAQLEQENVRLRLAIANLTLKRMAQILPQDG